MPKPNSALIYKIADSASWNEALANGTYFGSPDDVRDGFIHFSTAAQLAGTARKHFAGQSGLLLIAFDLDTLGEALKWEPSRGGELFPHFYGPLQVNKAVWARELLLAHDGVPQVATALADPGA